MTYNLIDTLLGKFIASMRDLRQQVLKQNGQESLDLLNSFCDQLRYRKSAGEASIEKTPLAALPNLMENLQAKIDLHLVAMVQEIVQVLNRVRESHLRASDAYLAACQAVQNATERQNIQIYDLGQSTHQRSPINELLSLGDEILTSIKKNLSDRQGILHESQCMKNADELKSRWLIHFDVIQMFDCLFTNFTM